MREFFFNDASKVLDDPKVVQVLIALYEYKDKQVLYLQARPDVLESLCEFAKAQSTDASNRIEGISTSKKRLGDCGKPRTAEESQRAGDRGVPRRTCPHGTAVGVLVQDSHRSPKCAVLIEPKHLTRPAPGPSLCRVPLRA